jgi:hypothetical protein
MQRTKKRTYEKKMADIWENMAKYYGKYFTADIWEFASDIWEFEET